MKVKNSFLYSSILSLVLLCLLQSTAQSQQPNVQITIKSSGSAEQNILDNWLGAKWHDYVRELFTDRDHNFYPNVSTNLGPGFIWDELFYTDQFYAAPRLWYQIHAKDNNGIIPKEKLVIKRWVTGEAAAAWDHQDELIEGENISFSKPITWMVDDDNPPYYAFGANDDVVNIDAPGHDIALYQIAHRVRHRINFLVEIRHADTGEILAYEDFSTQVEAVWPPGSGWIQHTSTFLRVGQLWEFSELDHTSW